MMPKVTIAALEAFIQSSENLLAVPIMSESNPIVLAVRTALIRQLVAADQFMAHLRDGCAAADCADLYGEMAWNNKIVRAGCAQIADSFE